ncbi:hypothetical protein LIER_37363 [Lithospermum erythrorhizon]|uniref:Uncharacterized protein n=1 Tax=Lithospermum erythrorhizon TaxID=34254 RepID=A0AAV3PLE1_LITER
MEPPTRFLSIVFNFICFLPVFIALLIIGIIKGVVLFPVVCIILTVGNSAIILGLWPIHFFYTCYCLFSTKQFGPVLKILLFLFLPVVLIPWPPFGILCSIVGSATYGLLAPMFATVEAVGEGKTGKFRHCIIDGTWDTVKGSFTFVRDFGDVCYHSYFSIMGDLLVQGPPEGNYYEIWLLCLPFALLAAVLGIVVDFLVISCVALFKSPYMLFKGWHRLFHDCIGREGPFLETICVPLAGLAIILWPLAVAGAFLASVLSSIFLGAYAAVVVYQESSLWLGLRYIVASLSIYDEYSNDVLDMPEGSCFPRPQYRKKTESRTSSLDTGSFSKPNSFKKAVSRTSSMNVPLIDLNPLELLDGLFKGCQQHGERMVSEGIISLKDIENAKSNRDTRGVMSIGLPAYSILQTLLRSAKSNSAGLILSDDIEITSSNRPKDKFYDWFLNPLLVIKEQIKAENLSETEEEYLGKLVLLSGDSDRLGKSNPAAPPDSELRRAELDALARRLRGITKSISRYPTFRRRFDDSMKIILEELANKSGDSSGSRTVAKSSTVGSMFSRKSFKNRTNTEFDQEAQQPVVGRDVQIA